MDFRTRIANQMGWLLLANLEGAQATEDVQLALASSQAASAEKDAQIAKLTPPDPVTQEKFDAAVDASDKPSGAPVPA